MANKKMTALCMAAMLAASLGSVASASESGISFPLEESYSFSIMTRAERFRAGFQQESTGSENGSSYQCAGRLSDHPG